MRPTLRRVGGPAAIVLALGLATGCSPTPDADQDLVRSQAQRRVVTVADASAVPGVVAATDALGLTMLATADPNANTVVSPASAVVALAMLAEGAGGPTAKDFDAALGAAGQVRTDAVNALTTALAGFEGDPAKAAGEKLPEEPLVHLANQAVVDDDANIAEKYLDALAAGYGAGVVHTDLGDPGAKDLLDQWVRTNSGGLVKKSAITPNDNTRLVLQNATVFAARWQLPFKDTDIAPAAFTLADGTSVQADAMSDMRSLEYAEVDGWQMVRVPYDGPFAAEVVLPPLGTDPATATPEMLNSLRADLASQEVQLQLPTVDVESTTDLRDSLAAVGLGELYGSPDLSGISDEQLSLGQATQQAVLRVDGEGTVAAAVTELSLEATAINPDGSVAFTVDHPYLFSVVHTDTSWSMFTAAIRDPRH